MKASKVDFRKVDPINYERSSEFVQYIYSRNGYPPVHLN